LWRIGRLNQNQPGEWAFKGNTFHCSRAETFLSFYRVHTMDKSLFDTPDYRLTEIDMENDSKTDSVLTRNLNYARLWNTGLIKPLSDFQLTKLYEKIEKKVDAGKAIHFSVRNKAENQLIGFVQFNRILWNHGVARLTIGIGDPNHLEKALPQLLAICLEYGFNELNLFRVEMDAPAYDLTLLWAVSQAGFTKEVTNREVIYHLGKYWDEFVFGILKPEWN